MQVGNKHSYKDHPNHLGRSELSASCEVVSEEKINVPAGTFDTFRISCNGFYSRVLDGNWSGKFNTNNWYAPSIQRVVKSQSFDFNQGGRAFNKDQTELTEFIPGK